MKKFILPILLLMAIACEKDKTGSESEYAYKYILRTYVFDALYDSLTFYYNHEDRLVRRDKCNSRGECTESYVTYYNDSISRWEGTFHFNENNEIYLRTYSGHADSFYEYTGGQITYENLVENDVIVDETFYFYEGENIVRDSAVSYQSDGDVDSYVTEFFYTDTLCPDMYSAYSLFFNYPLEQKYLLRKAMSYLIRYRFTYEISDNELVIYCESHDLFNDAPINTVKTWIIREEEN